MAADPSTGLMDNRIHKANKVFTGEREEWEHFSVKTLGYVSGLDKQLLSMMNISATLSFEIDPDALAMDETERTLSGQLYSLLTQFLEGDALDVLCNVAGGNGLEVLRLPPKDAEPKSDGHNMNRLIIIITPTAKFFEGCATYDAKLNR